MKRAIDNGLMLTDLDGNHHVIRNILHFVPNPPEVVSTDDPRLSDARSILDDSVTDESVADNAAISQSKLDLNGDIPDNYLGLTQAARGSLVQPLTQKDQIDGYASLGLDGKMPTGSVALSGTGTLHEVNFDFPISEITTLPDESGATRTFTGFWAAQDAYAWFGNFSGDTAQPTFEARIFPADLIPGFDASRIISGTFPTDQMPAAVGVGGSHAPGKVPPPGSTVTDKTAQPTDYLGRDMEYHQMATPVTYQPQLAAPSITVQSYYKTSAYVNITQFTFGNTIFYAIGSNPFVEVHKLPILVPVGATIQAYAAKIGYTNSNISSYKIPPNPAPPGSV